MGKQKTDAGYINISTSYLTALDLVFYADRIGGLNRAATVLKELASEIDANALAQAAGYFNQTTTLQRLGYLLEKIIKHTELSDAVYEALDQRNFYPTVLSPGRGNENQQAPNIWKVIPNMKVEMDL